MKTITKENGCYCPYCDIKVDVLTKNNENYGQCPKCKEIFDDTDPSDFWDNLCPVCKNKNLIVEDFDQEDTGQKTFDETTYITCNKCKTEFSVIREYTIELTRSYTLIEKSSDSN